MLLYIMLCIMLAYLMMLAALSNAVCLYNAFFVIDFCKYLIFHALSWFIDTLFIYFKYDFASCTVLLICLFFSNSMFTPFVIYERAMCSLEK